MNTELKCILLIDDDKNDNFFHERAIKKSNLATIVLAKNSGMKALEYLKSMKDDKEPQPDLIFLDINMPGMNSWDFLKEYNLLDKELLSRIKVIMLTTSDNPDDKARAKTWNTVSDYIIKPLTKEKMDDISSRYFIKSLVL